MKLTKERFRTILKEEISKKIISEGKLEVIKYLFKAKPLKEAVIKLLSNQFIQFIKDIYVTAPIPTTFVVTLNNDNTFLLIYQNKEFIAKISGKKYFLENSGDLARARTSLSELLTLSQASISKNEEMPIGSEPNLSDSGSTFGGGISEPDVDSSTSVFQPIDQQPDEEP